MFAGLTIPDKVATLLTESQQILGIASADGSMIPSGERTRGESELGGSDPPPPDLRGGSVPSEGSC